MKRILCLSLTIICAVQVTRARNLVLSESAESGVVAAAILSVSANAPMPDLIVRGNEFEFASNKIVNVYVSNNGNAPSKSCVLELTIRKIGQVSASRVTQATIPVIQPGTYTMVPVNAADILPINVKLADTTFKVVADATNVNAESNENNNEKWHNLT